MSMCLGVAPSSNGIEAGAGVLVFLDTAEVVLFLVAGRDFLVILWKEGRLVNFRLNNIFIIHCYHHHYSALLHLTSRILRPRLRLRMSCGVLAPAPLIASLLLRLVALVLCVLESLKKRQLKINSTLDTKLLRLICNNLKSNLRCVRCILLRKTFAERSEYGTY